VRGAAQAYLAKLANGDEEGGSSPPRSAVVKFLSKARNPTDKEFHAWAKSRGYSPDKAEEQVYALASGLLGGGLSGKEGAPKAKPAAVAKGAKVELEHTPHPEVAKKIAKDHLVEHPGYYPALAKMEKKLEKQEEKAASPLQLQAVLEEDLQKIASRIGEQPNTVSPPSFAREKVMQKVAKKIKAPKPGKTRGDVGVAFLKGGVVPGLVGGYSGIKLLAPMIAKSRTASFLGPFRAGTLAALAGPILGAAPATAIGTALTLHRDRRRRAHRLEVLGR